MHLTKLTSTTRLLLVAVVGLSYLCNCLAIWNLWCEVLDFELVIVSQAALNDIEVMLTLTLNDGLLQLLRVLNQDSWVLILNIVQQLAELLLVALLLSLDSCAVARLWEYDRSYAYVLTCGQSIVCASTLQLNCATNVTCRQLSNLDTVLTCNCEELRELLLITCAAIDKLHTLGNLTTNYAEICNLADVLLNLALEDECNSWLSLVGCQILTLDSCELRSGSRSSWARSNIDDELHQTLCTDVALTACTEDRHNLAVCNAQLQTRTDIVLSKCALLEIKLHKSIVVNGSSL